MIAINIDFWLAVWCLASATLLAGIETAFDRDDLKPVYRPLLFLGSTAVFFLPFITVVTLSVG